MPPIPAAEESLRAALALAGSKPLRGGHESAVSAVAFSPDGRWLATGNRDNAVRLWEWTEERTKQGKITSALETLTKIQRLEPAAEIYANALYRLCWFGSLWNAATEVMHTCDKAVELSPGDGRAHQGRGLARALTGNIAGAVEDFTMYLEWAPKNKQSGEDISLRQQWTEALKAHQNPFDAETLKKLRSQ